MSQETIETQSKFPYPSEVISMADSRNPCQKWGDALKNKELKKKFDALPDEDKSGIQKNLSNRTCQKIDGNLQCISVNNKFEPCTKMPTLMPNNIKAHLERNQVKLETQKQIILSKLDTKVENFRKIFNNLIKHHQTRQNMKSMSLNYKGTNQNEVGRMRIKQGETGDQIENDQRDKDFISGQVVTNRKNYEWYISKNQYLIWAVKIMLFLLLVIDIVYLMTSVI